MLESIAPMARRGRWLLIIAALLLVAPAARPSRSVEPKAPPSPQRPDFTDPILCKKIRSYRDFDIHEDQPFHPDEKLQIYLEPFNFLIVRDTPDGPYRASLSEDIQIRKQGSKTPLFSIERIVEFEPETEDPPTSFYLSTVLSLKKVPIGSYELDLTVRDEIADETPSTSRTIPFQVSRTEADRSEGKTQ